MNPTIVRFLILILVFAAVLLAAEAIMGQVASSRRSGRAVNERLRLIARGVDRDRIMSQLRRDAPASAGIGGPIGRILQALDGMISGAGVGVSALRLLALLGGASAILFALGALFAQLSGVTLNFGKLLLVATFSLGLGGILPLMVLSRLADRRRQKLVKQFPIALDVFIRGLRAGHPIGAALELLTEEMPDPIGSEFGIAVDETTYGADLRDSLQNMADRCGLPDMQMFVVSLSVQSETGGNLAEILENLSKVIRDRASMLMKVRALSSEGRMTAAILTGLPVLAFTGLFLVSPGFYLDVADDPAFVPGFAVLLLMYVAGFVIIRRLIDLKV